MRALKPNQTQFVNLHPEPYVASTQQIGHGLDIQFNKSNDNFIGILFSICLLLFR